MQGIDLSHCIIFYLEDRSQSKSFVSVILGMGVIAFFSLASVAGLYGMKKLTFGSMAGGFIFLFVIGAYFTGYNVYLYYNPERPIPTVKNQSNTKLNITNQSK